MNRMTDSGLTRQEAQRRLLEQGENRLKTGKKNSAVLIFAGQFKDGMVLILLAATALSAVLGEQGEALAIAAIVLANALLGFFQEWRCEKTLEALEEMAAPTARVLREGVELSIPAAQVVEGDILLFSAGDRVAADAVILEQSALTCDEALLTGESHPVTKRASTGREATGKAAGESMVFMGCNILTGRGAARVSATGMNTEMGAIAGMLDEIEEEQTPLQKRLDQVGRTIGIGCILICAVVAAVGVLRGEDPFAMLITGVSLAVAAVPEGLPAIVTISLALAVRRILRRNALIKRLHAVETLGCATVICSDKTGTLTQNKMTVKTVLTAEGEFSAPFSEPLRPSVGRLLETAAYCNDAKPQSRRIGLLGREQRSFLGEPTEAALLEAADAAGVRLSDFTRTGEIPFDSDRKRMAVWGRCADGADRIYVKGAPELLLPRCTRVMTSQGTVPLTAEHRRRILAENGRLAERALRVLGFALRQRGSSSDPVEEGLTFLGLAGLYDPPRKEAPAAVAACRAAGVRTVMITGDHVATASAVARQIGIVGEGEDGIYTGAQLDSMSDGKLREICHTAGVFARVTPAHKLRIVRAMKANGEIVAMTGDGVNDAPAVKEASIGVAMGESGTDVTREAAQVILLDDNFATLVAAVEEGRVIYQNIRRFLRYLLSCNTGEVLTMFLGMLMGMPVILTPIQLLLVNLVTDGFPAISLGLEPAEPSVMRRPPRAPDESIFSEGLMGKILFRGVIIGLTTLGVFSLFAARGEELVLCRTAALLTLVMTQLFHVFECRSETKGLLELNPFGNPLLLAAGIFSAACTAAAVWVPACHRIFMTAPLTLRQLGLVLLCSLAAPIVSSFSLTISRKTKPAALTGVGPVDEKPEKGMA
ncbi:MAG: cation-translocating P-type ATPase [Oscillospiraceae bacterium]|nr:cation-translocating P-type ATPase [Oscillospiraceae bacterium]MDY3219535.1 cation-translocating P-type ATPase [Candidatus Fimivivens sp.]